MPSADDRRDDRAATPPVDVAAVRERVLDRHRDLLDRVIAAADDADADLPSPAADGRAVATAVERRLDAAGCSDRLPTVLETAVDATGRALPADPVAAPPYVVVTSRGPVLRATLADGRLLVAVHVFDVARDPVRYVRAGSTPAGALTVRFAD